MRKSDEDRNQNELRLLIVDDEEAARYGIRRALSNFDCEIDEAGTIAAAREKITLPDTERGPDVVLLDVNLPGESGLDLLRELNEQPDPPLVVMITAYGSERMAVDVIKSGAHDYLSKPFEVDDLRLAVKNALETARLRRENEALRERIERAKESSVLLGTSEAMRRVRTLIEKVAETDVTVLIRGESGTGKELVAREVHRLSERSGRRGGAFVALNCAALPAELIESELFGHEKGAFTGAAARRQGKFEQADGGTLFLDEIGDMSANVQAKLLRALEERSIERLGHTGASVPVDVRIISATHRPLEQDIAAGNFRADLFYRLRVVTIEVPPLRDRREDVPLLAGALLRHASERYNLPARRLSSSALRRLTDYQWPGNVRELRNTIERAVVLAEGREIEAKDIAEELDFAASATPSSTTAAAPGETTAAAAAAVAGAEGRGRDLSVPFTGDFRDDRREFERRYIVRCLEHTGGNVTQAAGLLGMHRQSLQHKLRELGLARRYVTSSEKSDT